MNFTEIVKVNVTYLKAANIPDKAILTGARGFLIF
jgi:hypothetical protein